MPGSLEHTVDALHAWKPGAQSRCFARQGACSTHQALCKPGGLEHTAGALQARELEHTAGVLHAWKPGAHSRRFACRRMSSAQLPLPGKQLWKPELQWPISWEPVQEGETITSSMTERYKDHLTKGWGSEICLLCERGHITFPLRASVSLFINLRGGFQTFPPQRQKHLSAPKEICEETQKYKTGERNSHDGSAFVGYVSLPPPIPDARKPRTLGTQGAGLHTRSTL